MTDEQHCFPERTIGALCSHHKRRRLDFGKHNKLGRTNNRNKQVLRYRGGCLETDPLRPVQTDLGKPCGRTVSNPVCFPTAAPPPSPSAGNAGRKQPPELEPQPATSQWTGPSCRTSDHSWTAAGDGSEANDGNLVQDQQDCSGLGREEEQLDFMKTIALDDIITIAASATSAFHALKVLGGDGDDHGTCR